MFSFSAKMVVKKWNQIRDSWKRSLNAKKEINKSGSAAVNTKKYCYHDQLLFKKKNMDPAETQDSGGNKATNIEDDTVIRKILSKMKEVKMNLLSNMEVQDKKIPQVVLNDLREVYYQGRGFL
ncbi:hypothetical protein PYW08_006010 [Mythimna loreyi]|uniref:Uncharacterized protein n=1 Tax=Mythimna loreyi TaxID=667449 RepID=A0ACC2QLX8_9NEOP|nr:hypothetical protein PYW08_006010 [Mythimna loreyi]